MAAPKLVDAESLFPYHQSLLRIVRSPLIDSGKLEEALRFIVEEDADCMGVERVSIWVFDHKKSKITCLDLYEKTGRRHSSGLELKAADFPDYFAALEAERVVLANDALTDPSTQEFAVPYLIPLGIASMMDAPIRLHGNMIGVLCHEHIGQKRVWNVNERYFADVATEVIARAFAAQERLLVQDNLTRANRELEHANQAKDELLMVVSHELKTPLNIIGGWASLLNDGRLDADGLRLGIEAIARNVQAQERIIDDLLDTSRIVLGRLVLNKVHLDLLPIVRAATESARVVAEESNIKLEFKCDGRAADVLADPDRIGQVLDNLLSNAIKFTPEQGQITVCMKSTGGEMVIEVTDTGEGIEPELLPVIFERFTQGNTSLTRAHGGLGLGLAIANHLTVAHGGTLSAMSAGKGKGSTFKMTIPCYLGATYCFDDIDSLRTNQ